MPSRHPSIHDPLPIEIQLKAEKASALRRTGDKLEKLLAELAQTEREVRTLSGPARAERIERHRQLRAEAEYQRWCLIVHREAIGLWNHRDVEELYRLPPPVQ